MNWIQGLCSGLLLLAASVASAQEETSLTPQELKHRARVIDGLQKQHKLPFAEAAVLADAELQARRAVESFGLSTKNVRMHYRLTWFEGGSAGRDLAVAPNLGTQSRTGIFAEFWRYYLETRYGGERGYKIADFRKGLLFSTEIHAVVPHLETIGKELLRSGDPNSHRVLSESQELLKKAQSVYGNRKLPEHHWNLEKSVKSRMARAGITPPAVPKSTEVVAKKVSPRPLDPRWRDVRLFELSSRVPDRAEFLKRISAAGAPGAATAEIGRGAGGFLLFQILNAAATGSSTPVIDAVREIRSVKTAAGLVYFGVATPLSSFAFESIAGGGLQKLPPAARSLLRKSVPLMVPMVAFDALVHQSVDLRREGAIAGSYLVAGTAVHGLLDRVLFPVFARTPHGWFVAGAYEASKIGLTMFAAERMSNSLAPVSKARSGVRITGR